MATTTVKVPAGALVLDRRAVKKLLRYGRLQLLARQWLEQADRQARDRRRTPSSKQAPLPLPSTDLRPQDTVACRLPRTTMPVFACLTRRTRITPSGGGRGSPRFPECVGCSVGEDYARRCPGFTPPPQSSPAEVLNPTQRAAKRARQIVGLEDDDTVRVDGLREASEMTPDDDSDWRA